MSIEEQKRRVFNEFFNTVEKMRIYQRSYFNTRNGTDLSESKRLEREVDRMIRAIKDGSAFADKPEQSELFKGGEGE